MRAREADSSGGGAEEIPTTSGNKCLLRKHGTIRRADQSSHLVRGPVWALEAHNRDEAHCESVQLVRELPPSDRVGGGGGCRERHKRIMTNGGNLFKLFKERIRFLGPSDPIEIPAWFWRNFIKNRPQII